MVCLHKVGGANDEGELALLLCRVQEESWRWSARSWRLVWTTESTQTGWKRDAVCSYWRMASSRLPIDTWGLSTEICLIKALCSGARAGIHVNLEGIRCASSFNALVPLKCPYLWQVINHNHYELIATFIIGRVLSVDLQLIFIIVVVVVALTHIGFKQQVCLCLCSCRDARCVQSGRRRSWDTTGSLMLQSTGTTVSLHTGGQTTGRWQR